MKVIVGLGNPGPRYDDTRHNVGWWALDRLAYDWDFGPFEREGPAVTSEGTVEDHRVRLVKPTTYMNRSGQALAPLRSLPNFDPGADLLVLVDDAALDTGQLRLRPRGSAGGHNGLRSVEEALGTEAYGRLRIGVGRAPAGADLADWVLSPLPPDEEEVIVALLPEVTRAAEAWLREGMETAMNRHNR